MGKWEGGVLNQTNPLTKEQNLGALCSNYKTKLVYAKAQVHLQPQISIYTTKNTFPSYLIYILK